MIMHIYHDSGGLFMQISFGQAVYVNVTNVRCILILLTIVLALPSVQVTTYCWTTPPAC